MPPVVGFVLAVAGNLGIPAGVLTLAGKLLITVAISYAARALFAPDISGSKPVLRDRTFTVRKPTATRTLVYGQTRTNGVIVFVDTTGNNKFLHLVIAFAGHEIESFDEFYFDDSAITLSGNAITAPSRFAGNGWIYPHLGADDQLVDPVLNGSALGWDSTHRLRGIAYAYVKLQYNADAYPGGIPNITALVSGKKVYDPRTGTTAWSDNAALCTADYLMDTRHGLGVPLSSIDTTVLTTAANTCEETVTTLAGSEDRYTCNGVVDTDLTPRAILEALSTSKGAATVYNTGQWYIHAGSYRTPTISLDESDLKGPIQVVSRHPRADLFNQVKGVHPSPDNDWQPSDFPVVESSTYVIEDNGVVIWKELNLPFTASAATAQRLGLLQLNAARRQITVKAPFMLTAMDIVPSDVIQLSNDKFGWTNKTFEVADWAFAVADDMSLGIQLTLRETDSAVYTWSTADESAAHAAPSTNLPDFTVIVAPTGLSVSTFQVPTSDGDETYKALLTWTPPSDEFVLSGGLVEIEYKESANSDWLPAWFVNGAASTTEIPLLERDVQYDVRIRSFNGVVYSSYVTVFGFTVLGSGGTTTLLDYGLFSAAVTTNLDYDLFSAAVTTNEDYGSFT